MDFLNTLIIFVSFALTVLFVWIAWNERTRLSQEYIAGIIAGFGLAVCLAPSWFHPEQRTADWMRLIGFACVLGGSTWAWVVQRKRARESQDKKPAF
jgi:ABC-type Mn2+/Zn2+ transport system permease subunit